MLENVHSDMFTKEDSNQPAHSHSLISTIVVRMKHFASLANQNAPDEDADQTAQMRRLI